MPVAETRTFKMHHRLLFDVIQRQAGTLAKAILEGVMNSIDAKATKCVVTLTNNELCIADDGSGITSRESIAQFFETFGQPHEESERKTFGTFRMGRGQLFAYGKNRWRTGPFEMLVNVKDEGLDYKLLEHPDQEPGCTVYVDLYKQLLTSELHETMRLIRMWVKYSQIPVIFNGEVLTVDITKEKWTHVTPDAYVRLNDHGEVSIYNLGIYVCGQPNYRFGTGGVVVSRKQLKMNFARNDVQSDCPVWERLRPMLVTSAEKKMKPERLTDYQRTALLQKLIADPEANAELLERKLIELADGKCVSINSLGPWGANFKRYHGVMSFAAKGDVPADRVMQQEIAIVISTRTMADAGMNCDEKGLKQFASWIEELCPGGDEHYWVTKPLDTLTKQLSDTVSLIEPKKWTSKMRVWATFAQSMQRCIHDLEKPRAVRFGSMKGNLAWTDGETYVTFDTHFIQSLSYTMQGVTRFLLVLLHELAHDDGTETGHVHGIEFYEEQDELLVESLPLLISMAPERMMEAMRSEKTKLNKMVAGLKDKSEKLEKAGKELVQQASLAEPPGRIIN